LLLCEGSQKIKQFNQYCLIAYKYDVTTFISNPLNNEREWILILWRLHNEQSESEWKGKFCQE